MEMAMPGTPARGGPSWLWELSALAFAVSSVPPHMLLYSPDPSPLHPWCFLLQEALFTIRGEGSLSPIVLCCFTISDMQVIPLKWQKVKRNLRASWWKRGKEESEKAGLKLNIQKTNILASKSITSWQIEGEKVEAMTDFIFLASKITADSDCSHEFKRHLLLGRKALTNLDSILKSRDITLVAKVCIVKAMVSPVQFSGSVVSDSLQLHGLQHTRLPCPSPIPRACSNSCPLTQGCHPTISSSVIPFSSCLQSFPASGSFPMSQFFASGGQSIGASASASVLPMNIQGWFPLGLTSLLSLQSKGLSRVFSNITVQKHQFFDTQLFPTLTSICDYWKNHSFN